jgi:hypothetical protein
MIVCLLLLVSLSTKSSKVVQVELSLKRSKLPLLLKVKWQEFFREARLVKDFEGSTMTQPAHYGGLLGILNVL